MDFFLIDAKYDGEVALSEDVLRHLSNFDTVAVYSSIQFVGGVNGIVDTLEKNGIKTITSQPDRTSAKYQILGCDCDWKNLNLTEEPDAFLYVGDGEFHPRALILAQRNRNFKKVVQYNPISQKLKIFSIEDIDRILKKHKSALMKFMNAKTIGILVTTKPGQMQMGVAKKISKKHEDKKFCFFVDNNINYGSLEDFPFIDAWINTACPRIGFDDLETIPAVMLNVNDALDAEEILKT